MTVCLKLLIGDRYRYISQRNMSTGIYLARFVTPECIRSIKTVLLK